MRFDVAAFARTVQHHHGQDGHDHAAECSGQINCVDEADHAAVGQQKGRHADADHRNEPGHEIGLGLEMEHVDDVRQEAAADGPVRSHHSAQGEDVGDEESPLAKGFTPGDRGDLRDFFGTGQRDDGQRHKSQQHGGEKHARGDGLGQFPRVMAQAAGHFGHGILSDVTEDRDVEHRHGVRPVGVESAVHIRLVGKKRSRDNHADHDHHAGTDDFFGDAGGLQTQPDDDDGRNGKQQTAHLIGNAEHFGKNIAAAGHVGNHAADRVGRHGDEDEHGSQFADITLGQSGELQRFLRAQCRLGDVQH